MFENTSLIVLGIVLIIFELLFGAISGFDIALVGLSLIMGGVVHYATGNWQSGIITAIVVMIVYFVYFRKLARKKLLISTQKIGIDSLVGKSGVVIDTITKTRPGKVLIEGEVWRAVAKEKLEEDKMIMVVNISGVTLEVSKLKLT